MVMMWAQSESTAYLIFPMSRQHVCDHAGEALAGGDVQEFVGAVGVGVGAEHAGNQELRLGEFLAQHAHERNRAAFAHVGGGLAEMIF